MPNKENKTNTDKVESHIVIQYYLELWKECEYNENHEKWTKQEINRRVALHPPFFAHYQALERAKAENVGLSQEELDKVALVPAMESVQKRISQNFRYGRENLLNGFYKQMKKIRGTASKDCWAQVESLFEKKLGLKFKVEVSEIAVDVDGVSHYFCKSVQNLDGLKGKETKKPHNFLLPKNRKKAKAETDYYALFSHFLS